MARMVDCFDYPGNSPLVVALISIHLKTRTKLSDLDFEHIAPKHGIVEEEWENAVSEQKYSRKAATNWWHDIIQKTQDEQFEMMTKWESSIAASKRDASTG